MGTEKLRYAARRIWGKSRTLRPVLCGKKQKKYKNIDWPNNDIYTTGTVGAGMCFEN